MMMNRHDFLKSIAVAGMSAAVMSSDALDILAQTSPARKARGAAGSAQPADLVAVLGGEPEQLLKAALEQLGGLGRFVKKGQKICIKPNIGWDKPPEMAANTNPDLITALIKLCLEAGAAEVQVFDHTCDEGRRCYENSGIEAAVIAAGGKILPGNDERYYREVQLPRAKNLKTAKIHEAILDCDAWINVPVLKNHGGARMTIAMKNLMGIVLDRRAFHTNNLHQCIADICTYRLPVLNIVDAYRLMKSSGPRGRSESDVVTAKALFASTDIVAVDVAATKFIGQFVEMPLEQVTYLEMGNELGIGKSDLSALSVKRVKL